MFDLCYLHHEVYVCFNTAIIPFVPSFLSLFIIFQFDSQLFIPHSVDKTAPVNNKTLNTSTNKSKCDMAPVGSDIKKAKCIMYLVGIKGMIDSSQNKFIFLHMLNQTLHTFLCSKKPIWQSLKIFVRSNFQSLLEKKSLPSYVF